jgi:hypothetical protein
VAETTADGLDGDSTVDQFGGVGVAELVDADAGAGRGAVGALAVVGDVVGQGPVTRTGTGS